MKSWRKPPPPLKSLLGCLFLVLFSSPEIVAQFLPQTTSTVPGTPANPATNTLIANSGTRSSEPPPPAEYPSLPSLPSGTLPPGFASTPKDFSPLGIKTRGQGNTLIEQALRQLISGPPLEVKTRQSVRVANQSMVGVGRFIQAGRGQGRYRNDLVISLGDARCTLVQVNDGQLAWSSETVGDIQRVWRVNVMRLDEALVKPNEMTQRTSPLPSQTIVGLVELLHALNRDYVLETARAVLMQQSVDIARGPMSEQAIRRITNNRGVSNQLPEYFPDYVVIACSREPLPVPHLPVRIEYWHGDPTIKNATKPAVRVGLLEYPEVHEVEDLNPALFEFPVDRITDYEDRTNEYIALA